MKQANMGYFEAIDWLIEHDDSDLTSIEYFESNEPLSVTASFVADCFRKTDDELRKSMITRLRKKLNS